MLTCRADACSRDATESGYCVRHQQERDAVFANGGTLDGVQFEARSSFTRETFHDALRKVSRPVENDEPVPESEHRFGLKKRGRGFVWTREAALAAVREYVEAVGQPPSKADGLREPVGQLPSVGSATHLFGSWGAMVEAAGFAPASAPRQQRPAPTEEAPASTNGTVEVPADLIVELVGCAGEIEKLEASLATARERYHALLSQLHAAV